MEKFRILDWVFILALFVFSLSSVFNFGVYGWHDQQRVAQLLVLMVTAPIVICNVSLSFPRYVFRCVFLIAFWGVLSSINSRWPEWAFMEWGRYALSFITMVVVGGLAERSYVRFFIFGCMVFIGAVQVFQFLVGYVSAFFSGMKVLDADVLIGGFSNPRFFGQFQALLFPILAFFTARFLSRRQFKLGAIIMVVLVVQWCISYVLGGRGVWVAILLSHVFVFILSRRNRCFLMVQAVASLLGFFIFVLFFIIVPPWFDIAPSLYDGLRVGLSSREIIWMLSWNMAMDNMLLGVGPMHFSAAYNSVAAHPHQVLLQWLSEWGVVSALLFSFLVCRGVWAGARVLLSEKSDYEDVGLWTALTSGFFLAQVDGVFVMPYTEMWLAVLAGLVLSRWGHPTVVGAEQRVILSLMCIPAVVIMGNVLVHEAPVLPATEEIYLKENPVGLAPRFWEQGWIPMNRYGG